MLESICNMHVIIRTADDCDQSHTNVYTYAHQRRLKAALNGLQTYFLLNPCGAES